MKKDNLIDIKPRLIPAIIDLTILLFFYIAIFFSLGFLVYLYIKDIFLRDTLYICLFLLFIFFVFFLLRRFLIMAISKYSFFDDRVEIQLNFFSKKRVVYFNNKITTITQTQGIIQKCFNLSSIKINIYGFLNLITENGSVMYQKFSLKSKLKFILLNTFKRLYFLFFSINFHSFTKFDYIDLDYKILEKLQWKSNLWSEKIIFETSPKYKFIKKILYLLGFISVLLFIISIFTFPIYISYLIFLFLLVFYSGVFIFYLHIKNTNYRFYKNHFEVSFSYIFWSYYSYIPFSCMQSFQKIDIRFFSSFFKLYFFKIIAPIKLWGINLLFLDDYSKISSLFWYILKHKTLETDFITNISEEKINFTLRPGISYIINSVILSILLIAWILLLFFFSLFSSSSFLDILLLLNISLILFLCIELLLTYIHYKNIFYKIYDDKILLQYGLIFRTYQEIHIKLFKTIKFNQSFPFQRILKQADISFYIKWSQNDFLTIKSIIDWKKIFEKFSSKI